MNLEETAENRSEIVNRITAAVQSQDEAALQTVVGEIATFCFKESSAHAESFQDDVFCLIIDLLEKEVFLDMKGSHHLLLLFEYDWSTLNESQKTRLLEGIRRSYGKFRDWMSPFVITELLGQYYCDGSAFKVLTELESSSNEVARSLVPHGYEHFVKEGTEQWLREQAMSHLLSMKSDPSAEVRNEAEEALNNLT